MHELYKDSNGNVSLFTREWIEILVVAVHKVMELSPSLRGSGLKCFCCGVLLTVPRVSLFTREWIEISEQP